MTQLNPYRDATPWGDVIIGGMTVPGVVLAIDGAEKPQEWETQKATEKTGAGTVWKGQKPAEAVKITTALVDSSHVDAYRLLQRHLLPEPGKKPPTHEILNGSINFVGITHVTCKLVAAPKWTTDRGGYWIGEVTVGEYSPPKPTNTGGAGRPNSSTPDDPSARPNPNARLQQERDALYNEAHKQGLI